MAEKLYFISRYAVTVVDASPSQVGIPDSVLAACEDAHLVLIGHPLDNAWTNKHRCAFPYINFHSGTTRGFSLAGRAYAEPKVGVVALGTLPERGRLALLVHGTTKEGLEVATKHVPISSWQDGADFFVFGPTSAWEGEGGTLATGYLNELWQPSVNSWVEPLLSAGAPPAREMHVENSNCTAVTENLLRSNEEIENIAHSDALRSIFSFATLILSILLVAGTF
jgi:hypothetical protein